MHDEYDITSITKDFKPPLWQRIIKCLFKPKKIIIHFKDCGCGKTIQWGPGFTDRRWATLPATVKSEPIIYRVMIPKDKND